MDTSTRLALRFLEDHPDESARLLESLAPEAATALLAYAAPGLAADVLRRLVPSFGVSCLERLPGERVAAVIDALPLGAAAGLLRRIDAWDDATRDAFTRDCADRAHELARAGGLTEWEAVIEPSIPEGPALLSFVAARIAEERDGVAAYHAERARQVAWLRERLGL